ncbi:hypothetical protein GCM10023107_43900 [Actinoplanes octamycinicus]|nr:hypothetical protein Aoc01nite_42610 [Actinoplanes octamycinicus]
MLAALLVVTLAGVLIVRHDPADDDFPRPVDPWGSAGITDPVITVWAEHGRTRVDVDVSTRLPLGGPGDRSGFGRRVAKIAWRVHRGPMDLLVVGGAKWERAQLEHAFGARPAGLDQGQAPPGPPVAARDGAFHDFPARDVAAAEEWQRRLLTEIGRDHLGVPATVARAEDPAGCYDGLFGGIFGESATGQFQVRVELDLTLPGDDGPEARLPRLADHLAGLGLRVRTDSLDTGLPDVWARFGEEGRMSVTVTDAAPGMPPHLLIGTSSDCVDR